MMPEMQTIKGGCKDVSLLEGTTLKKSCVNLDQACYIIEQLENIWVLFLRLLLT